MMPDFYDSIERDLDALDLQDQAAEPHDGPGGTIFGVDYTGNAQVVKEVQAAINAQGYSPPLTVDGAYGSASKAGVQWLQTRAGLTPDGIVGDQTLGALGITPPSGVSVEYGKGVVKGAAAAAITALQQQFSPLFSWAASNPQPLTQGKGVAPGFNATKASVVNSFVPWTTPLEGFLPFMYIDRLGWVTTGMGNLIDPVSAALVLPWKNPDGSRASPQQIADAWNAVDSTRTAPKGQVQPSGPGANGGGSQGYLTNIRITKADVQNLVAGKLKSNEATIAQHLDLAKAPASAQMAAHSMSWAAGPAIFASFPGFTAAFNSGDYNTAAAQSTLKGTGIDMRNMANKLLLTNAAHAVANKKSPDTLYYLDNLSDLFTTSSALKTVGIIAGLLVAVGGAAYALTRGA